MSEHHTCDVLVVGLGPAGSTAARFAAQNGADVIAIDKRAEIGTPIQCAEGVSQSIFTQLELEPNERWISHNVSYVKLYSPGGILVDLNDERVAKIKYGYVLDRKVFDKDLATIAAKEGARILLKTRFVTGERLDNGMARVHARNFGEDVVIDAKVVIAADGVASRVGPYFGIRTFVPLKHMESCVQYEMTNVECEDAIEMFFGNVGIGIIPSLTDKNARYYLDKFLETPRLKDARVVEINAGGVPVSRPLKETYGDNIILAGDAARVVNPLTGGGISTAVISGKHAGTVAAQAVAAGRHDKNALARYQQLWKDDFGRRLEMFYKAQEVLVSMSDEELDDAARALATRSFESLSEFELVKALAKTNLKLLTKFKTFLH
jgi:digeranylgeranylglycerophospholipid reductase